MREFYEDIKKRKMNGEKLSPLESVILMECMTQEDKLRFHDRRCHLLLENIDRQEAAFEKQASVFHSILDQAKAYGQHMEREAMNALPPRELSQLRRNQKFHQAAEVYSQMRQGLSPDEIAEKLGISAAEVRNEQRKLIRLYKNIGNQLQEHHQRKAVSPYLRTLSTLLGGTYRVFRRDLTGSNSYRFYHTDRLIGTASAQILPDFPIVIQSNGIILTSSFHPENTIFPGVYRDVLDADNPAEPIARLTWQGTGMHQLELYWDTGTVLIDIQSQGEEHYFYQEGRLIAKLLPLPLRQKIFEWDLRYCLKACQPTIADQLAVMFLCFPLLRFA